MWVISERGNGEMEAADERVCIARVALSRGLLADVELESSSKWQEIAYKY